MERGSTQKLKDGLDKNCALTDVEGLSSLDFKALFLPCSGSFSGAPASKATPVDRAEMINKELLQQIGTFSSVYSTIENFSFTLHAGYVRV